MRALVDPRDGSVLQFAGEAGEFPVAAPLFWIDVPNDIVLRQDTLQPDGTVAHAVPVQLAGASLSVGGQVATMYVFQANEGLPDHTHADRSHNCILLQGAADVARDGGEPVSLVLRQPVSFAIGELHSITATADNTVIVNITDQSNS